MTAFQGFTVSFAGELDLMFYTKDGSQVQFSAITDSSIIQVSDGFFTGTIDVTKKVTRSYYFNDVVEDEAIIWEQDTNSEVELYSFDYISYDVPMIVSRYSNMVIEYSGDISFNLVRLSTNTNVFPSTIQLSSSGVVSDEIKFNEIEDVDIRLSYQGSGKIYAYRFNREDILK
jgi:hypothetical protein